jgi:hypothetical protein
VSFVLFSVCGLSWPDCVYFCVAKMSVPGSCVNYFMVVLSLPGVSKAKDKSFRDMKKKRLN